MLDFTQSFFCICWDDHMVLFCLLIWWRLIDFWMLNQVFFSGINTTLLWYMYIYICVCVYVYISHITYIHKMLGSIWWCFLKICIYVHETYWSIVWFSYNICLVLKWGWCSIWWIEKCSLLNCFSRRICIKLALFLCNIL